MLFIHLCLCLQLRAQDTIPSYNDYYNLHFRPPEVPHMWKMSVVDREDVSNGYLTDGKGKHINNRVIEERGEFSLPLNFNLFQSVLLPQNPRETLGVVFRAYLSSIDSAALVIKRLDRRERIIGRDTVAFNLVDDKQDGICPPDFRFRVNDTETEILELIFHAETKEMNKDPMALLMGCQIYVDSTDIGSLPVRQLETPDLRGIRSIKLDPHTGDGLDRIKVLQTGRLIALGESMHYHLGLHQLQSQVHKYLIKHRDARLILLERPIEWTLAYNRYINDPAYKADTTYWDEPMMRTAKMLRESKTRGGGTVYCYGYDYVYDFIPGFDSSSTYIIDFLMGLKAWGENKALDELAVLLAKVIVNADELVAYIDRNSSELCEVLSREEIALIKHIMVLSSSKGIRESLRFLDRESVMAENIAFLVDMFSPEPEKAVGIVGHLSHLGMGASYPPSSPTMSAGHLLKERFGDQYTCIGMLVQGGVVPDFGTSNEEAVVPVQEAPRNSVEFQLADNRASCFYMKRSKRFDRLYYSRMAGIRQSNALFEPANLCQRADGGLLFLDNDVVKETAKPTLFRDKDIFSFEWYMKRYLARREALLSASERGQSR